MLFSHGRCEIIETIHHQLLISLIFILKPFWCNSSHVKFACNCVFCTGKVVCGIVASISFWYDFSYCVTFNLTTAPDINNICFIYSNDTDWSIDQWDSVRNHCTDCKLYCNMLYSVIYFIYIYGLGWQSLIS